MAQPTANLEPEHVFLVTGMDCASCARTIEIGLEKSPGVTACDLSFSTQRLRVRGSLPRQQIIDRVRSMGFEVDEDPVESGSTSPAPKDAPKQGILHYLWNHPHGKLTLLGSALVLPGLVWVEVLGRESAIVNLISLFALLAAGGPVLRTGAKTLLVTKQINMYVLMSVAAIGAVVIGAFTEAAMVMVLFSLGELLEGYTTTRTRRSIRGLIEVAPDTALVFIEGRPEPVPIRVEALSVGDRILVKPGERFPMDGVVLAGLSAVNQAPITGESQLIEKGIGDDVFAGTINSSGSLEVEVTRPASETTLSRMIRLVEKAQERRAPAQRFVDSFARIYTPLVVALAAGVAILPPLLLGQPFWDSGDGSTGWLYRGLAVLVIACPCALILSTPVTIISAISNGARHGVLFKGGASLEQLSRVNAVALDKTGTLTEGDPAVVQVRTARCPDQAHSECDDCDDLVALASAVGRRSEHPLARAMVSESVHRGVEQRYPAAETLSAKVGRGVAGLVEGRQIQLGSHRFFHEGIPHDRHCNDVGAEAKKGRTPVLVSSEGDYLGFLSLADTVRRTSREAVSMLQRLGLRRITMLTGDNSSVAQKVSEEVGVREFRSELLPEDKVTIVEELKKDCRNVAMVGDGMNDAPALASASIGIAMGGKAISTNYALETADITITGGDLRRVPQAIRLSRQAMRTIRANVALSIGVKLLFLIIVVVGLGTMWMAVLADVGTSLVVTLNGMRLLRSTSAFGKAGT